MNHQAPEGNRPTSPNILPYGDAWPRIAEDAYVDPAARIIGNVTIGRGAGIWPGAVLRGDDDSVTVEEGAMVLENCVVEGPEGNPAHIGREAIISHGAVLHGAWIGDRTIVGVGGIVLDGAKVGADCIVGAGAVVPQGTEVPDGKLVLGVPGKVARDVAERERQAGEGERATLRHKAVVYRAYHRRHPSQ